MIEEIKKLLAEVEISLNTNVSLSNSHDVRGNKSDTAYYDGRLIECIVFKQKLNSLLENFCEKVSTS
jgi:hypothetical protein